MMMALSHSLGAMQMSQSILNWHSSIMADDGFNEIQRQLEVTASELKNANNPYRRRMLLREMSRLLAEAERISSQPPTIKKAP
jgi:hypothetical protein